MTLNTIEQRLLDMGHELSAARPASANYLPVRVVGNLAFVAGQVSRRGNEDFYLGRIGETLSVEQGYAAAKMCALNLFSQLRAVLGDLDRVAGCVSVRGFVNAVPSFTEHAAVIDGASDLIVDVLGESGRHARAAVGAGSLPRRFSVEVEAVFELHPARATD